MDKVNNLNEAERWFLSHSSGGVTCVDGIFTHDCYTYNDAKRFYEENDKWTQ